MIFYKIVNLKNSVAFLILLLYKLN